MMKKILSILLVFVLCFGLGTAASAEPGGMDFVIDDYGYLSEDGIAELNDLALSIYEETGVGIFFVYTTAESVKDYDIGQLLNGITDYVIMVENETHWYMHLGGLGETLDRDVEDALRAIYDETETYYEGVAAFLNAASLYFPTAADAPGEMLPAVEGTRLYDTADLLSSSEERELIGVLENLSGTYNAQIVVATVDSVEGGDVDWYVEYFYDTMGFGYGANRDGVLLLVCMNPREYRILSNGFASDAIDFGTIQDIGDAIVSDLSGGDYAGAFHGFAEECGYYLNGYINGFPFEAGTNLLIALAVGLAVGLITVLVLKGQLKSVRMQSRAHDYVKSGSMRLTVQRDLYLYRHVTRTKKESSNGGGGKSSGSSRSVGGGSF